MNQEIYDDMHMYPTLRNVDQVRFVRASRIGTDSWITYDLGVRMPFHEAVIEGEEALPGWEVLSGSLSNPDN